MKKMILFAAIPAAILLLSCGPKTPPPGASRADCPPAAPAIGKTLPAFQLDAFHQGAITTVKSADYRGKWLILFFYPADFSFVCPTELRELSGHYPSFRKDGAEVLAVSTDSVYVHRAWHEHNEDIKKVPFPMASDRSGALSRAMGVYLPDRGISVRASFIVDPDGRIVAFESTDESIGRSAAELLRKFQAARAVRDGDGGFCPANWHVGEEMVTPK